jgi:hypothetical protein
MPKPDKDTHTKEMQIIVNLLDEHRHKNHQ